MSAVMSQTAVRIDAPRLDRGLVILALTLISLGFVMLGSASMSIAEKQLANPFYFLNRQAVFLLVGLVAGFLVFNVSLNVLERGRTVLLVGAFTLLVLVLLPGIGREVNGSMRWISVAGLNAQPSELAKLAVIIFLAGYINRFANELKSAAIWSRPLMLIGVMSLLLLAEPDFGAVAVLLVTAVAMLFLGGMRLTHFSLLTLVGVGVGSYLIISAPYRLKRLVSFLDPWSDPFGSGFQLTQALIAFGRGEWFGVGLGNSVQKLFYLPEAHTDFLFAVMSEELGFAGGVLVIALFTLLTARIFFIGIRAEKAGLRFGAYIAYGISIWLGLQAFLNMGVNMGLLPTKGLTLPLMSYGGSSIVVSLMALALALKVSAETLKVEQKAKGGAR